jgi:EAL and modified HD-GYP domain-containing signal transduction protein
MTSPTAEPTTSLLTRRPILDRRGRIHGHELLLRAPSVPPEQAAATALVALGGDVPAWIDATRELVLALDPFPAAPGAVVLELDARTAIDDELVARLERLRVEGHAVALDDFLPGTEAERLLPLVDAIKLDLNAYGPAGVSAVLERLPPSRPLVVVYNVASPAQRDAVWRCGGDLVEGWFFELPDPARERPAPVDSVERIRALVGLGAHPTFEEVETVVAGDPGLAIRLLRFANSAAVGSRRRFSSVREAMVLLGSERVRQFLLLVLLSDVGRGRPALVQAAVLRGRLCERIAADLELADPHAAFTVGLLSIADALLDQRMVDVLRTLPISGALRWAIGGRGGPLGAVLDLAVRIERGLARDRDDRLGPLDEVFRWTDEAMRGLAA